MRTKLATTVTTATLIVLTMGLASAQAPGGSDRGGARSPGGAEAPRGAAERSEINKVSPADTKAPATQPATQGERRDPSTKSGASDRAPAGTNGRADDAQRGSRGERDQGVGRDKAGAGRDKGDQKVGEKGPSGDHRDRAGERDDKGTAERTRGERAGNEHGTTRITTEQRSRVKTIFQGHRSEAIHDVHFARRVGTIIPTEYRFRPLPSDIIEFLPEYRGYDYLIVDGEIIILEPGTRRIVDIID